MERNTFNNIFKLQCTCILRYDDSIKWVPLSNKVARFYAVALLEVE